MRSGHGSRESYTRTDFIEVGRELGIRAEESSRAFTRVIAASNYLDLDTLCSLPPCRGKYCQGKHWIKTDKLLSIDHNVLRDLVGKRSVTWKVLQQLLTQIKTRQGA